MPDNEIYDLAIIGGGISSSVLVSSLIKNGFSVTKSDFLVPGIKDNWSHYPLGNGFLVLE